MAQIKERFTKDKIGKNGEIIKGKKRFQAVIRIKGYKPMSAIFDRKTDAQIWANDLESKMKRGLHIKDNEAKKHTLADLIDRYIEDVLPNRKLDQQKVKMQLTWWKENIGACLLSEVKPSLIAEYRDKLFKDPINRKNGHRSASTVRKYMCSLSIALTKAINEWEWLDTNPMIKVQNISVDKGRTRFLTEKEHSDLLEASKKSSNKYLYIFVVIALSTGARRSEILKLTWDNVNLDSEAPMFYFMDTKNGENRAVPITGLALELVKEHSKVRSINSNLVFPRSDGKKPMDFRWYWEKAVKDAEIKDFTFHDTRHYAASSLAMNGASLLEIADILGHKTMAMVQRYAHLTKKHTASILKSTNEKQFAKHLAKK